MVIIPCHVNDIYFIIADSWLIAWEVINTLLKNHWDPECDLSLAVATTSFYDAYSFFNPCLHTCES